VAASIPASLMRDDTAAQRRIILHSLNEALRAVNARRSASILAYLYPAMSWTAM
jgi:hypothetical protein